MHASLNCKSWDFLVIRVTVYTLGGVPSQLKDFYKADRV